MLDQTCSKAPNEPDRCERCLSERCCETSAACDDDPDCFPFTQCVLRCEDEACRIACRDAVSRETVRRHGAAVACQFVACFDKSDCDSASANQDLGDICRYTECASDFIACYTEPDCYMYESCFLGCGVQNATCLLQCHARYPSGKALYDLYVACTTVRCAGKPRGQ